MVGWLCFCGGVVVFLFLCFLWCDGCVFVVVWLCFCGGGVAFLRLCWLWLCFLWWRGGVCVFFCDCVFVILFLLWRCGSGGVFVLVAVVFFYGGVVVVPLCSCGCVFVMVRFWGGVVMFL